jgi:hypothetical protein
MHYGPDETLRRNRPLSYLKVIGPVMLLDSLGIYGPNVGIILRTEPCKNAAACCVATHASSEALLEVSNRQYRNEGKVKQ